MVKKIVKMFTFIGNLCLRSFAAWLLLKVLKVFGGLTFKDRNAQEDYCAVSNVRAPFARKAAPHRRKKKETAFFSVGESL